MNGNFDMQRISEDNKILYFIIYFALSRIQSLKDCKLRSFSSLGLTLKNNGKILCKIL